jgi:hypothetical protein
VSPPSAGNYSKREGFYYRWHPLSTSSILPAFASRRGSRGRHVVAPALASHSGERASDNLVGRPACVGRPCHVWRRRSTGLLEFHQPLHEFSRPARGSHFPGRCCSCSWDGWPLRIAKNCRRLAMSRLGVGRRGAADARQEGCTTADHAQTATSGLTSLVLAGWTHCAGGCKCVRMGVLTP